MQQKQEVSAFAGELVSWWSWRPGIKPRNALILAHANHPGLTPCLHHVYALKPEEVKEPAE